MVQLNTESMTDNHVYVKKVMEMAGRTAAVNVETDLSFNNRPQAGYKVGTQSFCPMVEQDTSKNWFCQWQLPINYVQKNLVTIRINAANFFFC